MRANNGQAVLKIFKAMEYLESADDCFSIGVFEQKILEIQERCQVSNPVEHMLTSKDIDKEDEDLVELMAWFDNQPSNNEGSKQLGPCSHKIKNRR